MFNKLFVSTLSILILSFLGVGLLLAQGPTSQTRLSSDGAAVGTEQPTSNSSAPLPLHGQRATLSPTTSASIIEYTLPITPLNLLFGQNGEIWFSSFGGNAIGKLDLNLNRVSVYSRQGTGNVWGLKQDSQGAIWFSTTNEDVVGKLEPSVGRFTEWHVPETHFGLDIDPTTGDIWFTTGGILPGIYKLAPATNNVTIWATSPYTSVYDLGLGADGKVWFTVQPYGNQGVANLAPTTNQVTIWRPPVTTGRPFRVDAKTANEIWFTEFETTTNSIARLVPSANTLSEFGVPTPDSNPGSLVMKGNSVWFTEMGTRKLGRLDPASSSPTTTVSSPITFFAVKTTSTILPISYTVTAQVTPTVMTTTPAPVAMANGFTEISLPASSGSLWDVGLAPVQGDVWFSERGINRIGRLTPQALGASLFLPLLIKGQ
ncbi:MAG: hypothetical protein M1132_04140 [Chloroflexi bacterium]|nr:hypothetical protein [Chloroflexota bacterium]